jgi:hypothetical protein
MKRNKSVLWAAGGFLAVAFAGILATPRVAAAIRALRANIAETLLVPLITEQGGKEIQHEEHEDILSGPGRRAQ